MNECKKFLVLSLLLMMSINVQANIFDDIGHFFTHTIPDAIGGGGGGSHAPSPAFPSYAQVGIDASTGGGTPQDPATHFPALVGESAVAKYYIQKNAEIRNITIGMWLTTNYSGGTNRGYSLMQSAGGHPPVSTKIQRALINAVAAGEFTRGVYLVPYMVDSTSHAIVKSYKQLTNASSALLYLAIFDHNWNLLGNDLISTTTPGSGHGHPGSFNFSPGCMSLNIEGARILKWDWSGPGNVFFVQAVDQLPTPPTNISSQHTPSLFEVAPSKEGASKDIAALILPKKDFTALSCNVKFMPAGAIGSPPSVGSNTATTTSSSSGSSYSGAGFTYSSTGAQNPTTSGSTTTTTTTTTTNTAPSPYINSKINLTNLIATVNSKLTSGPLLFNVSVVQNNNRGYKALISVYQNGAMIFTKPVEDLALIDDSGNYIPDSAVVHSINFEYQLYGDSSSVYKDLGRGVQCAFIQAGTSLVSGTMFADKELFTSLEVGLNFQETGGYGTYLATAGFDTADLASINTGLSNGKEVTVSAGYDSSQKTITITAQSPDKTINKKLQQSLTSKSTAVVNTLTQKSDTLPSNVSLVSESIGYKTNNMDKGVLVPHVAKYVFKPNTAATIVGGPAKNTGDNGNNGNNGDNGNNNQHVTHSTTTNSGLSRFF